MKTLFIQLTAIVIIVGWGIAACAGPVSQLPPTETPAPEVTATATQPPPTETPAPEPPPTETPAPEPVAAVLEMVERLNAGDVEGSLAYFADDAMGYIVGLPPTGMEVYKGKEQIRSLWGDSASNHFQWEVKITGVSGNEVRVRAKTWHDFTRELGVAPLEWFDIYEVEDGKITTYSTTITKKSLARLKPALAEVMPPEPPAAPSSDTPVSEMTVTIAEGTCTYNGPMALQAGEIQVTIDIKDQDKAIALAFFNLDAGKDNLDLMASTIGGQPSWADDLLFVTLVGGQSETYSFTVEEGPVYMVCFSKPPDIAIGNAGPFTVSPVSAAVAPPTTVPEGPVSAMTVTFAKGTCTTDGSMVLQAGEITVTMNVEDLNRESYLLTFFNLDPGKSLHDLIAAQDMPAPPPWADMFSMQEALPGQSKTYNITIEEGPVYLLCWSQPPGRVIGKAGPVKVSQ